LVFDVSKGRSTGTDQARGKVGASGGNAPTTNSGKRGEKKYLYMYVCTKHADQPTKQSATPYRLFHVASVEPLWLK